MRRGCCIGIDGAGRATLKEGMMSHSIFDLINVPRALTLEFLATFARFEFALKKAGYVRGNEARISPDWERFGRDVSALDAVALAPITRCCVYLQAHPPRKQVLIDGRLQWVLRSRDAGSEVEDILLDIRTVRNNVFHGGKFPDGPIAEPLRDEQLITDCVTVLQSLLELPLPNGVSEYFNSEA